MTDMIFQALRFATNAHSGQFRKSTKIPYIVHPIDVMQRLIQCEASTEAIVAGILHDTLEDTPTTADELRAIFGDRVTDLVQGASELDKSLDWESRKQHTVATLRATRDIDQLLVVCADKLSNITSIANDLRMYGDAVWSRFNRGYESQKWYYMELAQIFAQHTSKNKLFAEYVATVTLSVFTK